MNQKTFSIVTAVIFTAVALDSRHRGLVGTDVVQLDWPYRCRWPRFFRVQTRSARGTLQ